jgi:hypothetical protein
MALTLVVARGLTVFASRSILLENITITARAKRRRYATAFLWEKS